MTPTGFGSEGDAYRYTKKVLLKSAASEVKALPVPNGMSWTRAYYEKIRRVFFRDGQSDIRYAPGVARIVSSAEVLFATDWEKGDRVESLREIVRLVSMNHRDEYDRHLNNLTYVELEKRYGRQLDNDWNHTREILESLDYGPARYDITELVDFATANAFLEATGKHRWCHLAHESTLDSYRRKGTVRLYIATLPGYESITEDDPLYGESMLGIDVGKDGRLIHVNNRWNHDRDSVDERKGDNKYTAEELSSLMGGPFYKFCPPYGKSHYAKIIADIMKENASRQKKYDQTVAFANRLISRGKNATLGPVRKFVDPRDGKVYRHRRIGKTRWMLDPMAYECRDRLGRPPIDIKSAELVGELRLASPPISTTDSISYQEWEQYSMGPELVYEARIGGETVSDINLSRIIGDVVGLGDSPGYFYGENAIRGAIPDGWRLPTPDEVMELISYLGEASYSVKAPKLLDPARPEEFDDCGFRYILFNRSTLAGFIDSERMDAAGFSRGIFTGDFPVIPVFDRFTHRYNYSYCAGDPDGQYVDTGTRAVRTVYVRGADEENWAIDTTPEDGNVTIRAPVRMERTRLCGGIAVAGSHISGDKVATIGNGDNIHGLLINGDTMRCSLSPDSDALVVTGSNTPELYRLLLVKA